MTSNSNPRDDSRGSAAAGTSLCPTPNLSPAAQPQSTPVKPATGTLSSPANSNATPRLLFTWNPYTTVNPTAGGPKPPEEEGGEEGRLASSIGGCSTTSSVANVHNGGHGALAEGAGTANTSNSGHRSSAGGANSAAAASAAAAAVAAAATPNPPGAARPPLTISALLAGAGGVSRGSPPLSAAAPMLSPKQSHVMMHQSPLSDTGGGISGGPAAPHAPASAASTPSGPVLKRIPTTTRDGRQYFLDYSPTTSGTFGQAVGAGTPSGAAATTVAVAAMPNLMLPPNTSPSLVVTPTQHHDPQLSPPVMEILDLDGGNNTHSHNLADAATTPPQVAPLMSPPRSGGIGMHHLHPHHPGSYPSYATAGGSSSTGGGGLVMGMGSGGGSAGAAQHNPYRTSPTFYSSVTPPPGVAVPGAMGHVARAPPPQQQQQQHQDVEESDADLVFTLESEPSVFITRLLPPPPPLPELARVLTVPGVVQSLCVRWCTYVAAVLRSSDFAAVTAAPPPPPSAVALMPRETPSPTPAATTGGSTTKEELAAWYETALRWWEALEQEGAKTVDVRVKSRAVSAAVEAVASGRASRVPMNGGAGRYGGGGNNAQRGGGGAGGQGFRGRGGRGGAYNSYGAAGNATMSGGRGGGAAGPHGRGAAAPVERGSRGYGGAHYYTSAPPALPVGVESHQVIPDEVDPRARCNTAFYASGAPSAAENTATAVQPSTSSNFNPYAESWHFSGDTGVANTAYGKGSPSTGLTAQQQQRYNSMNA